MCKMNLDGLLRDELQVLRDAETEGGAALARMTKATTAPSVRAELIKAADECSSRLSRLDVVLAAIDEATEPASCSSVEYLGHECDVAASDACDAHVRDARILGMARVLVSYALARYENALLWARALGHDTVVFLIEQTTEDIALSLARLVELSDSVSKTAARLNAA